MIVTRAGGVPWRIFSLISDDGHAEEVTLLKAGDWMIGRDPFLCDIPVPTRFPRVGKVHAKLYCDDTDCRIQEIHPNGAYINDHLIGRLEDRPLADGDFIYLADPPGSEPAPRTYQFTMVPPEFPLEATDREQERLGATVLLLMSGPAPRNVLEFDAEVQAIVQGVRSARNGDQISFELSLAATLSDLEEVLLQHTPSIIHFSGCGNSAEGVILPSISPPPTRYQRKSLASSFRIRAPWVRCIVLNACYTRELGLAISEHVNCVIRSPAFHT